MTVITTKDGSWQSGMSIVAFNKHLRAGHLPGARQLPNGNWIVTQEMVDKFIEDRKAGFVPKRGRHPKRKTEVFNTCTTPEPQFRIDVVLDKPKPMQVELT